jgi:ubiquinone/menaquinone biosynthesis C-methylase UbiE
MVMHQHVLSLRGNRPALFEGRASRVYDVVARRLVRGLYRRIVDDLVEAVPECADLLDVGTGPGVLLMELAGRRPDLRLTGVDLSADMVTTAQRNVRGFGERVSVRVGDVVDLPFRDDVFDVVVTSLSMHHWDHPADAVPELARVLRPRGRLFVYDFGFAPFDVLTDTARERGVLGARPVRPTTIRTGVPIPSRCVRQVMTA